jgi:hypothetical protein
MKKIELFYVMLISVLILSACGTSRRAMKTSAITQSQDESKGQIQKNADHVNVISQPSQAKTNDSVSKNIQNVNISKYLSSKIRVTVPRNGSLFTLGGSMKMVSNERIQLSVVMPIFHNELMKMDVTPDEVLVIDRVNKQYIRAKKEELSSYLPKGSNFDQLVKLLEAASKPGGKSVLTASEIGLKSIKDAKLEFYDFSTDEILLDPTNVSTKYKKITLQEFAKSLKGLQ